jgi:phosphoglycerol transferase MdoB-like AlkP superfamily enzyme
MREGIAQQIDIMPTILGLLGYQQPYCAFGIDLFTTPADDTWAVNYLNGTYQYVSKVYVLQFDGKKTTALYRLGDWKMEHNIVGTVPEQEAMELKLKAIIQQYMLRLTENRLTADKQ